MVHLVPDDGVDDGPVLATAEVPIDKAGSLDEFERSVHGIEHRLLVQVLADACADPAIIDTAIARAGMMEPRPREREIHA